MPPNLTRIPPPPFSPPLQAAAPIMHITVADQFLRIHAPPFRLHAQVFNALQELMAEADRRLSSLDDTVPRVMESDPPRMLAQRLLLIRDFLAPLDTATAPVVTRLPEGRQAFAVCDHGLVDVAVPKGQAKEAKAAAQHPAQGGGAREPVPTLPQATLCNELQTLQNMYHLRKGRTFVSDQQLASAAAQLKQAKADSVAVMWYCANAPRPGRMAEKLRAGTSRLTFTCWTRTLPRQCLCPNVEVQSNVLALRLNKLICHAAMTQLQGYIDILLPAYPAIRIKCGKNEKAEESGLGDTLRNYITAGEYQQPFATANPWFAKEHRHKGAYAALLHLKCVQDCEDTSSFLLCTVAPDESDNASVVPPASDQQQQPSRTPGLEGSAASASRPRGQACVRGPGAGEGRWSPLSRPWLRA
ncbi:hypothetical protein JKP88DRAFT_254765 [Tribonema minus]|uniref:Uncharacterized protein n=1 Tax=Tribonema minus TaxID=303371 RepID=A0A836CJJ4_9STRA|nr:hypothetical protein JKP88DRAFT_254765 [Tribonema minus]